MFAKANRGLPVQSISSYIIQALNLNLQFVVALMSVKIN